MRPLPSTEQRVHFLSSTMCQSSPVGGWYSDRCSHRAWRECSAGWKATRCQLALGPPHLQIGQQRSIGRNVQPDAAGKPQRARQVCPASLQQDYAAAGPRPAGVYGSLDSSRV